MFLVNFILLISVSHFQISHTFEPAVCSCLKFRHFEIFGQINQEWANPFSSHVPHTGVLVNGVFFVLAKKHLSGPWMQVFVLTIEYPIFISNRGLGALNVSIQVLVIKFCPFFKLILFELYNFLFPQLCLNFLKEEWCKVTASD